MDKRSTGIENLRIFMYTWKEGRHSQEDTYGQCACIFYFSSIVFALLASCVSILHTMQPTDLVNMECYFITLLIIHIEEIIALLIFTF